MPAANPGAASMRDVAKLAGVSHQTVSRVINDSPALRPETKARVQKAIDELGYRPNALARALAHGRSRRIGVLIESSSHYGPMSMLRGIEVASRSAGYFSTTYTMTPGSRDGFREGVEFLNAQEVEAVAVIAPRRQSVESLSGLDLPRASVLLGTPPAGVPDPATELGLPRVWVDQAWGADLAVNHLIALGHRRIAHLAGPQDWFDGSVRCHAWRVGLQAAGLRPMPVVEGDWSADSGHAAAHELAAIEGLTAVFAANDQMALGLIHGLSDLGLRVPEDISIHGFDDIPESGHFLPPLTTIHQDFQAVGEAAVATLLGGLGEEVAITADPVIAPTHVVRSSVAALG